MSRSPLIWADDLSVPIAWHAGQPISRRQYLADVRHLAARLPEAGAMLNLTGDRYRFLVGLGAALVRGQNSLLPPNHTPDMIERLRGLYPSIYVLTDLVDYESGLLVLQHPGDHATMQA